MHQSEHNMIWHCFSPVFFFFFSATCISRLTHWDYFFIVTVCVSICFSKWHVFQLKYKTSSKNTMSTLPCSAEILFIWFLRELLPLYSDRCIMGTCWVFIMFIHGISSQNESSCCSTSCNIECSKFDHGI